MRAPLFVAAAVVLLLVAIAFTPYSADQFGYALPFPNGLPSRFERRGDRVFIRLHGCIQVQMVVRLLVFPCGHGPGSVRLNADCASAASIQRQIGFHGLMVEDPIPTLFGRAHPVRVVSDMTTGPITQHQLAFVKDGPCYVSYLATIGPLPPVRP